MAQNTPSRIDEKNLTKGELRKLNALRKSIGPDIGDKAFIEWLSTRSEGPASITDPNAEAIAEQLWPKVEKNEIRIPRGGYLLRRGRGRLIVEPAKGS